MKKNTIQKSEHSYSQENTAFFIRALPKILSTLEDRKQDIRASGSIAANYIEANEKFGGKDFLMRTKIVGKEAKEARYWPKLLKDLNNKVTAEGLFTEAAGLRLRYVIT